MREAMRKLNRALVSRVQPLPVPSRFLQHFSPLLVDLSGWMSFVLYAAVYKYNRRCCNQHFPRPCTRMLPRPPTHPLLLRLSDQPNATPASLCLRCFPSRICCAPSPSRSHHTSWPIGSLDTINSLHQKAAQKAPHPSVRRSERPVERRRPWQAMIR